jgi:hypothetical protein
MRPLLATMSNVDALLPGVLLGACLNLCASEVALSEPVEPAALEAGAPAASACEGYIADHQSAMIEPPCAAEAKKSEEKISEEKILQETAEARVYLVETANPGGTMTRQGPELAIGRLHPEFAVRLASALREAREAGLTSAGIFSAYRPPAFGVGGFRDKFNSLHTYGLAVDMYGIGSPGSAEAQRWHEIAAKHGVVCPYGSSNRAEWNHCQPTRLKMVTVENPLRETVSADGPLDLETMFEVGTAVIEGQASAIDVAGVGMPVRMASLQVSPVAKLREARQRTTASGKAHRQARIKAGHSKMARRSGDKHGVRTAGGRSLTIMAEERRQTRKSRHASASLDVKKHQAKSRSGSAPTRATTRAATAKKIVLSRVHETRSTKPARSRSASGV